jgi:hypothetical protein
MEACVDLYRGPRTIPRQSTVVVFNLGLGGVPGGGFRCRVPADPSHVARPCFGFQGHPGGPHLPARWS